MIVAAWWILAASVLVGAYAYVAYPLILGVAGLLVRRRPEPEVIGEWPLISITVPAYNEETAIARTLERILAADYPSDRRQVLVISDGSTDRTDEIVRGFADRGIELLRLPQRSGKTAAENAAWRHLRGDIVINTDASVQVHAGALKALARQFADPSIGVASSRDVSVASVADSANVGESRYVGYEMWVRALETRVYGIVGASGSLYAIRAALHRNLVPEALSRDFASAMIAREFGFRSVSVNDALCSVPRARSLRGEYRRKLRTMTRGLETLWYKRHLLNPFRYGRFAWMLLSHKLVRWLVPWSAVTGLAALALLSVEAAWARWALAMAGAFIGVGLAGWAVPEGRRIPAYLAVPAYVTSGVVAALHAWIKAVSGELNPVWEPTRRDPV